MTSQLFCVPSFHLASFIYLRCSQKEIPIQLCPSDFKWHVPASLYVKRMFVKLCGFVIHAPKKVMTIADMLNITQPIRNNYFLISVRQHIHWHFLWSQLGIPGCVFFHHKLIRHLITDPGASWLLKRWWHSSSTQSSQPEQGDATWCSALASQAWAVGADGVDIIVYRFPELTANRSSEVPPENSKEISQRWGHHFWRESFLGKACQTLFSFPLKAQTAWELRSVHGKLCPQ